MTFLRYLNKILNKYSNAQHATSSTNPSMSSSTSTNSNVEQVEPLFIEKASKTKLVSTTTTIINRRKVSKVIQQQQKQRHLQHKQLNHMRHHNMTSTSLASFVTCSSNSSSMISHFKSSSKAKFKFTLEPISESSMQQQHKYKKSANTSLLCRTCCIKTKLKDRQVRCKCKCCGKKFLRKIKILPTSQQQYQKKQIKQLCYPTAKHQQIKRTSTRPIDYKKFGTKLNVYEKKTSNKNIFTSTRIRQKDHLVKHKKRQFISNSQQQPCCLINGETLVMSSSKQSINSLLNLTKKKKLIEKEVKQGNELNILANDNNVGHYQLKKFNGMANINLPFNKSKENDQTNNKSSLYVTAENKTSIRNVLNLDNHLLLKQKLKQKVTLRQHQMSNYNNYNAQKPHSIQHYHHPSASSTFLVDFASTPVKLAPKTSTPIKIVN